MCGIAGFAGGQEGVIERMTGALMHRGPDRHAVWRDGDASLGHCRLAILDPRPDGDQPMWNDDRTIAIVFNGEIYNYRDLREAEHLQCRTNTDTEVILRMYEKHGMTFIRRLRGMFAFGIYDRRADTWHLARDHKGIKPLFVAYPEGKLAFASEMRSLMAAMPRKPALNMHALSLYLRLQYVPGPQTMCEGIEQLPPGTVLTRRGQDETRTVFRPEERMQPMTRRGFRERFPDIMEDTVRRHLVSDKPVGLFLSGGMDSSIVLHHMSMHAEQPVRTFTVRFEASAEEDAARFNADAELAAKTAAHYGAEHQDVFLNAETFRDIYRETARALDQPNANPVAVAQFLLSRQAKKHVDVVLTGSGGDELFGGYPRYRIARILQAAGMIPPAVRSAAGRLSGNPPDVLAMKPDARLAERLLARPRAESAGITRGGWFDPAAVTALFDQRFSALAGKDPVRAFMEFDRGQWLVDESLRLTDATTMGNGLEGRVPFVDEAVIAAAHAVPASWHVTLGRTKALLKDTYRDILPAHLYDLKKASFFSPLAKWLRRECAVLAEEMLEHPRINELFDTGELRLLLDRHKSREQYGLYTLSTLIQLSHWFNTVYDA